MSPPTFWHVRQRARLGAGARRSLATLLLTAMLPSCSPDWIVGGGGLPPDLVDPGIAHTPAGALAAYRGALVQFRSAYAGFSGGAHGAFVLTAGLLSDELQSGSIGAPLGSSGDDEAPVDSRNLPEYADPASESGVAYRETYISLQKARGQASEALGLLAAYMPDSSPALPAHVQAIRGYAELLLADLFCSGIPLSTVDYNSDYTLQPGSSTEDVYRHAVALFDSSLAGAADSTRVLNLARVGKGRALLGIGDYASAAQAVAEVPDGYKYLETFSGLDQDARNRANFAYIVPGFTWNATISDREGGNGLDFISSGDPRSEATASEGTNFYGATIYLPTKYAATGDTPVVLADWIEARLIEAEAALRAGNVGTWLAILNHLRETAITPALPDTTDPGTPDERVNLLFRERAAWLFLTGHRQGDLRRLIRQYGRNPATVYPIGMYPGANGAYGSHVTAPIPASERAYNPRFTGCINRGA
jgi:hypothetical protein